MPGRQGAPVPRPTRSFVSQSGPRPLESLPPAHRVVSGAGDPRAQHWGGGGGVQSRTQAPERLLPVHRAACDTSYCPKPVACPEGSRPILTYEEGACCPSQNCSECLLCPHGAAPGTAGGGGRLSRGSLARGDTGLGHHCLGPGGQPALAGYVWYPRLWGLGGRPGGRP